LRFKGGMLTFGMAELGFKAHCMLAFE
jgi:hypothetical protein